MRTTGWATNNGGQPFAAKATRRCDLVTARAAAPRTGNANRSDTRSTLQIHGPHAAAESALAPMAPDALVRPLKANGHAATTAARNGPSGGGSSPSANPLVGGSVDGRRLLGACPPPADAATSRHSQQLETEQPISRDTNGTSHPSAGRARDAAAGKPLASAASLGAATQAAGERGHGASTSAAAASWEPARTAEQQHVPPSPASTSSSSSSASGPAASFNWRAWGSHGSGRGGASSLGHGSSRVAHGPTPHKAQQEHQQQPRTKYKTAARGRGGGGMHPAFMGGAGGAAAAAGAGMWPSAAAVADAGLLAKIDSVTNWYELRAVLASSGGGSGSSRVSASGGAAAAAAASPAAAATALAVLRRLAAVTRYDMRPAECAALGAFLERWLLESALPALPAMRAGELAAALHAAAKLARALPAPPPAWFAGWFAAAAPHLRAAAFRPKDVSLSLWALSKLETRPPAGGLQLLLAAAEPHLHRFNAQDLSLVALALAALRGRDGGAGAGSGSGGGGESGRSGGENVELQQLLPSGEWRELYLARVGEVVRQEAAGAVGSSSSNNSGSGYGGGWGRSSGRGSDCGPQALCNLLHGLVRSGLLLPVASDVEALSAPATEAADARGRAYGPSWLDGDEDVEGPAAAPALAGSAVPMTAAAATAAAAIDTRWLLDDLCTALYGVLPQCTPQGLANALSALAAARHVPEEGWVERFFIESAARMDTNSSSSSSSSSSSGSSNEAATGGGSSSRWCNADDLAHLAAAAAELRLAPPRWWAARLYGAMERRLTHDNGGGGGCSARQLSQMLHGAAQLHRSYGQLPVASAAGSTADAAALLPPPPPAPTVAPDAAAPAARPPPSLMAAWHRAAAAALPGFNAVDASHSLWALAALGERPPPDWLQRLLVGVRGALAAAPPSELAVLLWALAELRFRPTWSWIADCVEASSPGLAVMEGQDFAMLLSGLVRLGGRPKPEWSARLLTALAPRLQRLQLRSLSQCVWALYRLRVQPPPDLLTQLAAELRRRWLQQAAAASAAASAGAGAGDEREQLRHSVLLLWVLSTWLGSEGRKRRAAAAGPVVVSAGVRSGAGRVPGGRAGAPRFRLRRPANANSNAGGGGLGSGAPASVDGPVTDAASPRAEAAGASPEPPAAPACRLSSRMLRRRRAARSGSLVASLGGEAAAAAALRRSLAAQLLLAALAATEPLLAARRATPQDAALLAAVVRRLPRQVRRAAAAAAPAWPRALLDATAPLLPGMTHGGLLQTLAAARLLMRSGGGGGGTQQGGAAWDARWAAAAERAVAVQLAAASPPLPCAARVTLLRRLAALGPSGVARSHGDAAPPPSCGSATNGGSGSSSCGCEPAEEAGVRSPPLLLDAVAAMRRASGVAEPLVALQAALLRAGVRLRKLRGGLQAAHAAAAARRARGPPPAASAALAAAAREVAAAAELAATAAAGSHSACSRAALVAAQWRVQSAVAAATRALLPPGRSGGPPDAEDDEADDAAAAAAAAGRSWPRQALPPLSAEQRRWIQARAERTVAAQVLTAAPPEHVAHLAALAAVPLAAEAGRTASDGASAQAGQAHRQQEAAGCLLWLAAASNARWRYMRRPHRALAARTWRAALASLELSTPALARQLAEALPCAVTGARLSGDAAAAGDVNGSSGQAPARDAAVAAASGGVLVSAGSAAAKGR